VSLSPSNAAAFSIYFPYRRVISMKRFATVFVALGLATAGSTALADQAKDQLSEQNAKPQPVQMTEAQLDNVAAGAIQVTEGLVNVTVGDVTVQDIPVRILTNSVNGNTVQVPVAANVNAVVGVLGNARGLAQQFGRQL
jgi:hypothetical protein